MLRSLMLSMRDGVRLACDVYLPEGNAPRPALLMRTPYLKENFAGEWLYSDYQAIVDAGYALVIQDVRGVGASEGVLDSSGASEYDDGYDTVEAVAAQPWCDGRVAMYGLSYFGFTQMAAASAVPEHLVTICPFQNSALLPFSVTRSMTLNQYHLQWLYSQVLSNIDRFAQTEAEKTEIREKIAYYREHFDEVMFKLPIRETPAARIENVPLLLDFVALVDGVEKEEFWKHAHKPLPIEKIKVPMFFLTGWFDGAKDGTLENYAEIMAHGTENARENSRLVIGPWGHGGWLNSTVDGYDFGEENSGKGQKIDRMTIEWLDRRMKEGERAEIPRVCYFTLGENRWHEASEWPPRDCAETLLYLSGKKLLPQAPSDEEPDKYDYDPEHPLPSRYTDAQGRTVLGDSACLESRADVLNYRSEPLEKPLTITGNVSVDLFAATSAVDTDFFARISDEGEDGISVPLLHGIVRARYRNGRMKSEPVTPGEIVSYTISLGEISAQLSACHRIKLEVSSSNYPEYDRNLNTGEPIGQGREAVIAHQTVYHDAAHPSALKITVKR